MVIRPLFQPSEAAQAEGPFTNIQFSGVGGTFMAFDTRSGDVWCYETSHGPGEDFTGHFKITQLGKPVQR
jgi:hypothetical protein